MNYRLTALTPLLVGDGQKLSPIDYMVWKDQVNVLDQPRIFRLLSKGPRLESYLTQIRKAEKLDFASWGGFAQNFADRRIPFEDSTSTAYCDQARADQLHIPTFSAGPNGPYLPASALKGALRTALTFTRGNPGVLKNVIERMEGDRPPRRLGETAEALSFGSAHADPTKGLSLADSGAVPVSSFKVYLVKVSSLVPKGPETFEVAWKPASTLLAEMAVPGTVFEGPAGPGRGLGNIIAAARQHSTRMLELHRQYAERAGLAELGTGLGALQGRGNDGKSCLVNIGWGGGFLGKTGFLDTEDQDFRRILKQLPYYERAIRSGLPFPKTRRIVFSGNRPAALPGWALLEFS
ncbi:MAG TPA: type III-A CRISPR-associated RAMP protein Csm5 [Bryobacteraceae bacterium]|nr:type III-A CRISPR-associated RAMP protein Csm5 [Bryobacteraceae bacterium]